MLLPLIILKIKHLFKIWRCAQSTYYLSMIYVIDFKVKKTKQQPPVQIAFGIVHS